MKFHSHSIKINVSFYVTVNCTQCIYTKSNKISLIKQPACCKICSANASGSKYSVFQDQIHQIRSLQFYNN